MSEKSFPSKEEILSTVPKGRVPYIKLNISLGEIEVSQSTMGRSVQVIKAIEFFAKADADKVPEPPLPEVLSELLQSANGMSLVKYRNRTEEDALRDGNIPILEGDYTREGILLLHAIADHGRTS